jgi:hypothetical protein
MDWNEFERTQIRMVLGESVSVSKGTMVRTYTTTKWLTMRKSPISVLPSQLYVPHLYAVSMPCMDGRLCAEEKLTTPMLPARNR